MFRLNASILPSEPLYIHACEIVVGIGILRECPRRIRYLMHTLGVGEHGQLVETVDPGAEVDAEISGDVGGTEGVAITEMELGAGTGLRAVTLKIAKGTDPAALGSFL